MKKNKLILLAASFLLVLASCKKDFLEEKRDLTGVNEEVFQDPVLAQAYVDYIYSLFLPGSNAQAFVWSLPAGGNAFTQTTDELAGETNWNKTWANVSYTNAHALSYFGNRMSTSIGNNTWTRLRQINLFLTEIEKYGVADELKKPLVGQMLFWRAYEYFQLVRLYGGVPIVLTAQDPIQSNVEENKISRSKSSEVIEQIVQDLNKAITLLPGKWPSSDWGRITSGAAAAMKGRVLLTWASPQFNRSDDRERWKRAYDANLEAKTLLETNGFGLYQAGGTTDGKAWGNMFTAQEVNNPEAVIVFGFNNIVSDQTQKWNGWEHAVRPRTILGNGSIVPTKQIMDAFPMKDGKMINEAGTYTYDPNKFYKNRDPRFYKTFAYNGSLWPYAQNANYRVWTYRWYANGTATTPASTTERAGTSASGLYLAKATAANATNATGNFSTSGTDFMELRFAEVVLNLAESAIGYDRLSEGLDGIKAIRERAGVENQDGMFGLSGISGRDALFAAVLNERKVEFAYESKRFWDLRRWLLFNNDYGTVARLGFEPIDGMRRTGLFITVKKADGTKYTGNNNVDPLYKPQNTGTPIAEREPQSFPAGITSFDEYLDYLYDNHFVVSEKDDLDPTSNNWKFKWYNEYYFFGLNQSILNSSPYLEQTQGWNGINGSGTFDPLK